LKKLRAVLCIVMVLYFTGNANADFTVYENTINTTDYTPWFRMYHMQTAADQNANIRGGEGGQVIMSMACSKINPDLMLFGSDTAQLWRSTDGGDNWTAVDGINMWSVADIAFHPNEKDTVYIIETMADFSQGSINKLDISSLDGLYKSTDGGKTFHQVLHKQFLATFESEGLIQFDNQGNVYALSSEGVFKSADGETWQSLGTVCDKNTGVYGLYVSVDGSTIAAATAQNGIRASFNGGLLWSARNGTLQTSAALCVNVDPTNENHWFAVYGGVNKGLYQSSDKGNTWTAMSYPTYADKNVPAFIKFGAAGTNGIPKMYLVYNIMAYPFRVSNDLGQTWQSGPVLNKSNVFTYQITGYQSEGLCVHPTNPNIVYYSFSDVVFKSTDGGQTFNYSSSGFSGDYCRRFIFDSVGKLWMPFTDKGIGVTDGVCSEDNYPTAHMVLTGGTATDIAFDPNDESHMITALGTWTTQKLYESTDGGTNWSDMNIAEGGFGLVRYHENGQIIYTSSKTSYDEGITWNTNTITISAISPVDNDVVYGFSDKTIYRSDDCGITWNTLAVTSAPYSITADNFNADTVWVGCYDGSIRKIDGTQVTIFNSGNGLPQTYEMSVTAFAQNPNNQNHLLAGGKNTLNGTTSPGLYESLDGGLTWHQVEGMPSSKMIFSIGFSPVSSEVFLGTYSGTIIYDYEIFGEYLQSGTLTRYFELYDKQIYSRKEIYCRMSSSGEYTININQSPSGGIYTINSNTSGETASLYYEFSAGAPPYIDQCSFILDAIKINAGGSYSIYAVDDDEWENKFSPLSDGIYQLAGAQALPEDAQLIVQSENLPYNTAGAVVSLNVADYVRNKVENGNRLIRLHVVYRTATVRTVDGARVCSRYYSTQSRRPHFDMTVGKAVKNYGSGTVAVQTLLNDNEDYMSIIGVSNITNRNLIAMNISISGSNKKIVNVFDPSSYMKKEYVIRQFLWAGGSLSPRRNVKNLYCGKEI